MDEAALIQMACKGDLDAFNRIVLAYQTPAYNLAYRILSDEDSAADATQNAFISAYRNLKQYRGGSFKGWLLRSVTNQCYDELRRKKRRPTVPIEPVYKDTDEEIDTPSWLADPQSGPEQVMEEQELEHAIQHCINNLPIDFRTIVVMVEMEQMDYEEVSQATGSPLGTIKSRLARARQKMRDCLQGFKELLPYRFRLEVEEKILR